MKTQRSPESEPGDVLDGRFALKRLLGRGALGTVWEGTDISTGVPCVIKLLPTSGSQPVVSEYIQYLQGVHGTLAGAGTPNLYLPIAQGEAAGIFYQVLRDLPDARSLDLVIRDAAPMKPERALRIIRQVATGLAALHAKSIVHADLKPTNIPLSGDEDEGTAYVADLGMTRAICPADARGDWPECTSEFKSIPSIVARNSLSLQPLLNR
jgi:serine/threonine protein kinase